MLILLLPLPAVARRERRHGLDRDLDRAQQEALSDSVSAQHRSSPRSGVRVEDSRTDRALDVCDLQRPGAGRGGGHTKQVQPILRGLMCDDDIYRGVQTS